VDAAPTTKDVIERLEVLAKQVEQQQEILTKFIRGGSTRRR
jgi:hypothetical protein